MHCSLPCPVDPLVAYRAREVVRLKRELDVLRATYEQEFGRIADAINCVSLTLTAHAAGVAEHPTAHAEEPQLNGSA